MEKEYRENKFRLGQSIKTAVKVLKNYKVLVCGSFNGIVKFNLY